MNRALARGASTASLDSRFPGNDKRGCAGLVPAAGLGMFAHHGQASLRPCHPSYGGAGDRRRGNWVSSPFLILSHRVRGSAVTVQRNAAGSPRRLSQNQNVDSSASHYGSPFHVLGAVFPHSSQENGHILGFCPHLVDRWCGFETASHGDWYGGFTGGGHTGSRSGFPPAQE